MNKLVVITGGSSGIGESLVLVFSKAGYEVVSIDIKKPRYEISGVNYIQADITSYEHMELIAKTFSGVDVLINNAAVQFVSPLLNVKNEDIKSTIDVNILGTINVTKAFALQMHDSLVINVGSVHSTLPRKNKIAYDMSKAAMNIFTKEIALELAPKNIRSICVEFGAVDTPMNKEFDENEEIKNEAIDKQVIKHLLSSEECAQAILGLTKDEFKYLNGAIIKYDCGRSIK